MESGKFDFNSLLDDQFRGIRRGYKFGTAFNDDKSLARPAKPSVADAAPDGRDAALKAACAAGEAVPGVVEKEVKGGYEVTVLGQRAFCPFSQIDRFRKDASEYVGRAFDFVVTECAQDERGLNVVVSRRALLDVQAEAAREAVLDGLHEGETLNGTVTRVFDFGAFVDLGGLDGLVPAREIAWERVEDPREVLKPGDGVTVRVLRVDREAGKVALSRKECLPRVFRRSPEEEASARSAAEVAEWMKANAERNARVGSLAGAFAGLKLGR